MMRWFVLACIAAANVSADTEAQTAPAEAQDSPTMKATMECMPGMKLTGEKETLKQPASQEQYYGDDYYNSPVVSTGSAYSYRYRFSYSYGSNIRYGWRYPLSYWNAYGRNAYGGDDCSFDRAVGDYYYC